MPNSQCMLKALEYIDKNITMDISLYDIAFEAGFSVPHFYRLFRRLTGDTVGSYILRRKLSLAASDIKNSDKSIGSIAFEYGFESHDVFTRAFTRVYGVSPKRYRQGEASPPLKRYMVEGSDQIMNDDQMMFRILHSPKFEVIGMECDAKVWDEDCSVGGLWSDFLTRMEEIKQVQSPMTMYGICEHENCDGKHFKYMAGIGINNVKEVPQGMTRRCIREQSYLQASVPASISVPDAYSATIGYAKSLGYEIEDYDNIEVYDEIFKDPAYYSFQLLIPVKE